jgi:hypothetical protein
MHNHIIDFVNRLEILYPLQYGFQKNHSTVSSLIYLMNKIATSTSFQGFLKKALGTRLLLAHYTNLKGQVS